MFGCSKYLCNTHVISYCLLWVSPVPFRHAGRRAYCPLSSGSGLLRIFYKLKTMMKSKRLILCLLGLCGWFVAVQAQTVALKTDLVNWATASLNLEPEVKVGRKSTMALGLSWNPWTFSDNKKWRHLRVQPEYRYWICRPFGGHFLGLHASYTRFNAGGVNLPFGLWPKLEDQRVQGNEWAVGLGYGYHWILSRHWSLEAELGLGYSFADFDAYECRKCGDKLEERTTHRFVPTKLSVSFIYVFK